MPNLRDLRERELTDWLDANKTRDDVARYCFSDQSLDDFMRGCPPRLTALLVSERNMIQFSAYLLSRLTDAELDQILALHLHLTSPDAF